MSMTIFWADGAEDRKYLYKLQELGVLKLERTKNEKPGVYNYSWKLTEKGDSLVEKNNELKNLLNKDIIKFYDKVLEIMGLGI